MVESFRRDFIADVSHEIKTPLTGIIGSVDLLMSSEDIPRESKDRLMGMVKSESVRLNDIAQGILSLARLERDAASGSSEFAPTDVSEIVREVAGRLDAQAKGKGIKIRVDVPESCMVLCDGQLISGALSNLLVNAIRHSGADMVLVSVSESADFVTLTVEDHGVGVPAEHRARVFERFYRVDRSRGADTGGAGLGLAIVRSVADLHRGVVARAPVQPSGCRFSLSIPRFRK